MVAILFLIVCVIAVFILAIRRASLEAWAIAAAAAALIWQTGLIEGRLHAPLLGLSGLIGWLPAIVLGLLSISTLRRSWLTGPVYHAIKKALPRVSDTEQQALDAGTIGFDAELFSGKPDWEKLRAVPPIVLTPEERAFLDGPTDELCRMIDDWQIRHAEREIPEAIWDFVKRAGLPRHADLEGARRPRLLAAGAVADPRQDRLALARRRDHRHGAELARARRTDRELRHRRAEAPLPAAPRARASRCRASR